MPHRVFLVDDSPLMLELYGELIDMQPDMTLAGTASSASEALLRLPDVGADVALVDVSMPTMSGLELVRRIGETLPGVRCILFSAHSGDAYARRATEAGARGYVEKGDPAALLTAVRLAVEPGAAL